jgi:hypothetical protein
MSSDMAHYEHTEVQPHMPQDGGVSGPEDSFSVPWRDGYPAAGFVGVALDETPDNAKCGRMPQANSL